MKWYDFKNELMKDPPFKQAYNDLEPAYQIVRSNRSQGLPQGT